jgi:proton-dependent oligopeptide transporter, POT family
MAHIATPTKEVDPAMASDRRFFGHPLGLATLFFTEMWERFSYYGMRALLKLFMPAALIAGGFGMTQEESSTVYAIYTSMVYLVAIPGGWLADNFLGQRRSLFYGGILIMIGHILLALHGYAPFFGGLAFVIIGTGFLKPNISTIVGQLYSEKDQRRDAGFSIFYMGINLGAFLAPLGCGWLAQSDTFKGYLTAWGLNPANSWHWGFGLAAVGMAFGLVTYVFTQKHLGTAGLEPNKPATPEKAAQNIMILKIGIASFVVLIGSLIAVGLTWPKQANVIFGTFLLIVTVAFFLQLFLASQWTPGERSRLIVITVLFAAAVVFWGVFEQAGSTLTTFADKSTNNEIFGYKFPSSWWQSVNAIMIIVFSSFFAWLWLSLGDKNPSYPAKFGIALLLVGLSQFYMIGGALGAEGGNKVGIQWLVGVYLLQTLGELCLSPVGLSSMTRLAPQKIISMIMGVWFLGASVGNFLAGFTSGFYEKLPLTTLFTLVGVTALVMAAIMFALVKPVKRMLALSEAETKAATPAE